MLSVSERSCALNRLVSAMSGSCLTAEAGLKVDCEKCDSPAACDWPALPALPRTLRAWSPPLKVLAMTDGCIVSIIAIIIVIIFFIRLRRIQLKLNKDFYQVAEHDLVS